MTSTTTQPFSELCLQSLNSLNNENLTLNAISKAFSALYIYDYLLTIGDEVKFAWKGRKTWLFSIYVLNRYATMGLVLLYWIRPRDNLGTHELFPNGDRGPGFPRLHYSVQVYAVSRKNKPLMGVLVSLMGSQLIFGIFSLVWTVVETPMQVMTLPDCEGVYRSCALGGNFQLVYTALSLTFDVPAFMAIIRFSHPWRRDRLIPTIHRTVCQDSTAYFLSVLSIQIFVTVAVSSGAAYPRALFPIITNVFIPLMVSRIVLSLRRAAYSQVHHDDWTVGNLTIVEPDESLSATRHEMQFRKRAAFSVNAE